MEIIFTGHPMPLVKGYFSKTLLAMKLTVLLLLVACLPVSAHVDAQNITYTKNKAPLEEIFMTIRKQTGYEFLYNTDMLKTAKKVDVKFSHTPLRKVLGTIFDDLPFTYTIVGKTIVVKQKARSFNANSMKRARADTVFTIKGRVFNTQEPPVGLPGVVVRVKGTGRGTVTDEAGYYTIEANKGDILVFSLIGFTTEEHVVLKQYKNLVISLQEKVSELNQVQVVGMTSMEQQHIASSLSSLNVQSNIEGKPITSLSQALQGGVTGLQVRQASGLPGGDAATIKIRGISTLGNSDPLVLVDGVPMDMEQINPNTVESVTILKDAAAAAIYGARAANGVILITTKRGEPGRISLTYDGYYGYQTPSKIPEFVDAPTYMRMYNIAQINSGGQPLYSEEDIQKTISGEYPLQYPSTDWAKQVIDPTSPITNHSISVTGGNHLARFAITGSYMFQDGMMPVLKEERYNLRANTSITLTNNFYFYLDVLAIKRDNIYPNRALENGGTRILDDMYRLPPTVLPKYPKEEDWPIIYGRYADIVNPIAYFEQGGHIKKDYAQSSVNLQPRWEVLPGLNIKGQFSFRLKSNVYHAVRDNFYFFDYYTKQLVQTWKVQRTAYSTVRNQYYYLAGTADYTWKYKEHRAFAMAGYSQEVFHNNYWDVSSLQSAFGKLNYSFKNKYLLEASLRADGSSKFGPGHKFGYFPSVAVGWNVSKEDFLKDSKWINSLKLRASYGQLGNENIGLYKYQSLISASDGLETKWGNPDITWERVNMLDIGADVSLFENNKLNFTVDYYNKLTKGLILTPVVSMVGALGSAPLNAGKLKNQGWEFSADYADNLSKDISLFVRAGVSYNKNTILDLTGGPYIGSGLINKEGYSVDSYFGYKTDGLLKYSDFEKDGTTPKVPIVQGEKPGDIKYIDLNGDGEISSGDETVIGNAVPDYNYFADISINWKRLNLEFLLQGTQGGVVSGNLHGNARGYLYMPLNFDASGGVPTTYRAAHTWRRNNTDARFPRLNAHPSIDLLDSDFWFWNGSYLRVKFAQLSYDLSSSILEKKGIRNLQVYFNAQNPFVATSALPLVDPESKGGSWTYGIMKMYTIGVHLEL